MKIAYAFALVGNALNNEHVITHVTAVRLFLLTAPRFDVISVQTENMKQDEQLESESFAGEVCVCESDRVAPLPQQR